MVGRARESLPLTHRRPQSNKPLRLAALRERYLGFAEHQARGSSARYESLARAVADSDELLEFVRSLSPRAQQPNLFLASVRWECGLADDGAMLALHVREHGDRIRATAETRRTQTNEPHRCATLLPVLASLPQPLALLEVGASAGLCLLPDRYGYDFGERLIPPSMAGSPTLSCQVTGGGELPEAVPEIAWRRGLDLNPIDVGSDDQMLWLENLIWPEHEVRRATLRAAREVALPDPPVVLQGDLRADLPAIAATAPSDAHLVVFHSAVLNYLGREDRAQFRRAVDELGATWLANEGPSVFPDIAARAGRRARPDRFVLSLDGEPIAFTGFHGRTFEWL